MSNSTLTESRLWSFDTPSSKNKKDKLNFHNKAKQISLEVYDLYTAYTSNDRT